jgi:hypothetical protein
VPAETSDKCRRFLKGALLAGGGALAGPQPVGAAYAQAQANGAPPPERKNHYFVPATDKGPLGLFQQIAEAGGRARFSVPPCLPRSTAVRIDVANASRRYGFSISVKPSFMTCKAYWL